MTPAATTTGTVVARYPFDRRGTAAMYDTSGYGHTLRSRTGEGGAARSVVHGPGLALAFRRSAPAPPARQWSCRRAPPRTSTRYGRVSFGASVLMFADQTDAGENVLQKGYSATGGQYKLQVDGTAGRPSCVMVDSRRSVIRLVRSAVSVADGAWHRIECRR